MKLQNITKPSITGLSTAMKLSEERRKHLLDTVINKTIKRQHDIDNLYLRHSPSTLSSSSSSYPYSPPSSSSSPSLSSSNSNINSTSHQHSTPLPPPALPSSSSRKNKEKKLKLPKIFDKKLEKIALLHLKEINKSSMYINSLEPIVASHKLTIASDNVIDTTKTRDLYNTSIHTIIEDPNLDIGYKDGIEGRKRSLNKLHYVNSSKFIEGTFININHKESKDHDDYTQYDSHYTVYAPKEVIDTSAMSRHHHKRIHGNGTHPTTTGATTSSTSGSTSTHHTPRQSSLKNIQRNNIPKLSPIIQQNSSSSSSSYSLPSQRFPKLNFNENELPSCDTGRITFRKQPSSSRLLENDSSHHTSISPIPTGRKFVKKSISKIFLKKQNSSNLDVPPTSSLHDEDEDEDDPTTSTRGKAKRRSSVVKHFYRQNTSHLPSNDNSEHS